MSTETTLPAAVLVPLIYHENTWQLLFIKRAEVAGDRFSGQIAFPGGKCEPDDRDRTHTALRETEEEIGIAPGAVEILASLPLCPTGSRFVISPILGYLPRWPQPMRLAGDEVAATLTIPLSWLAAPNNIDRVAQMFRGEVIFYHPWQGEILWGASARIVKNLLEWLDQGRLQLPAR